MRDVENEVRELLEERSADIELDPRIPARMVRRARRRRAMTAGAAGLCAAALALVVVAGLGALPISDGKTPVTPAPAEGEMPSSFVGVKEGELVLASTNTGEVLRVIADRSVVGSDDPEGDPEPPVRPALTPDRSAVYFSTFRPDVEGRAEIRLVGVPLEGGEPEDLGRGTAPAVSPDGDRLAYRNCAENGCGGALVILDVSSGEETRVEVGDAALHVGSVVWLRDGRFVVELTPPMDGSPYEYRVIDPARAPAELLDAPSVVTPPDTVRWGLYAYHASTGGVIVGQQRTEGRIGGVVQLADRLRLVSVDPDTGEVLATVMRRDWSQIHPDTSGRNLLLLDGRGRVYVSRDGGEPELMAEGFSDVDW